MDTVEWSQQRYEEIVKKLSSFLKQTGFREGDVSYVPCSGLSGENLCQSPKEAALAEWYQGPTLAQGIGKSSSVFPCIESIAVMLDLSFL